MDYAGEAQRSTNPHFLFFASTAKERGSTTKKCDA